MSCLKGKKEAKEKPGNYRCSKCGAVTEKKKRLCKPEKIEGDGADKATKDKSKKDKPKKKDKGKKKGKGKKK